MRGYWIILVERISEHRHTRTMVDAEYGGGQGEPGDLNSDDEMFLVNLINR